MLRWITSMLLLNASTAFAQNLCQDLPAPRLLPGSTVEEPASQQLCDYFGGPAVLVVNTASQCGYTPQFKGLEALYQRYREQGLMVLGFPSDNFGGQEYADAEKTAALCYRNYGVSFPVFEKSDVKGANASPLFRRLAQASAPPRWNFHKYLVTAEGVEDFASSVTPLDERLVQRIEATLAAAP